MATVPVGQVVTQVFEVESKFRDPEQDVQLVARAPLHVLQVESQFTQFVPDAKVG